VKKEIFEIEIRYTVYIQDAKLKKGD